VAVSNRAPTGVPRLTFLAAADGRTTGERSYGAQEIPLERITAEAATDGVIVSGQVQRGPTRSTDWRDTGIRLDRSGAPVEELWAAQDLHTRPATASDGALAFGRQSAGVPDGDLVLRLPDSTLRTLLNTGLTRSVAFAPDGDVVAVIWGVPNPDFTPLEWHGMWLARFGRDGSTRWRRALEVSTTDGAQVAVATDGTIVFTLRPRTAGESVRVEWGATTLTGVHSLFVLAATSSGEPRWARAFGDASVAYSAAVDPARGIALVKVGPAGGCPSLGAELLRFDASRAWTRDFPCSSGTIAGASPVVGTNAPVHVAGVLRGAFDFGAGTLTSEPDGSPFVVQLVP
jgi:hypothetical protein